ncbi:hypothetical protein ONZ45_g3344 [Pleurotus djamor]|nr:hypothetical protein ONZ45_g3344 [Pleurotus djamor]
MASPYAPKIPSRLRFELDPSQASGEIETPPIQLKTLTPLSPVKTKHNATTTTNKTRNATTKCTKKSRTRRSSITKDYRPSVTDSQISKKMLARRILMKRFICPPSVRRAQRTDVQTSSPPSEVKPWAPTIALAHFDLWNLAFHAGAKPPVVDPLDLSRLLQIGWITLFEANACGGAALRSYRKTLLMKALIKSGRLDGKKSLKITDSFLGLTTRPLHLGGGRSIVRWEDGEQPWRLNWAPSLDAPPLQTHVHKFNSHGLPRPPQALSIRETDAAHYAILKTYKPSSLFRIKQLTPLKQSPEFLALAEFIIPLSRSAYDSL